VNRVAVRNILIVMAIAGLVFVSQQGFGAAVITINRIILVLFVVGLGIFAYQYFRSNELAWYVIPSWGRKAIVACCVGIGLLMLVGFPLLSPYITPLGVIALMGVLLLVIVWIVRESRRFR
jgi:hypothetical protein